MKKALLIGVTAAFFATSCAHAKMQLRPVIDEVKPNTINQFLHTATTLSSRMLSGFTPLKAVFMDPNDLPGGVHNIYIHYGDGLSGREFEHMYTLPGNYVATITFEDENELKFKSQIEIQVKPDPTECRYSRYENKSYAKKSVSPHSITFYDYYYDDVYVGRSENSDFLIMKDYVYTVGISQEEQIQAFQLSDICRAPASRYIEDVPEK